MANSQSKNQNQNDELKNEFKLERYKYILQEIHSLNENIHKYVTLFQTLATAIISGGVLIVVSWQQLNISAQMAQIGLRGLVGLLIILALFVVVLITVGIFSWVDYRKEEVELLNEVVRPGFRRFPNLGNWWRWHEVHIMVFVLLIVVIIYIFVENQVIPQIK